MAQRAVSPIRDRGFRMRTRNYRWIPSGKSLEHPHHQGTPEPPYNWYQLLNYVLRLPPSGFHCAANRIHYDFGFVLVDEMTGSIDDPPRAAV